MSVDESEIGELDSEGRCSLNAAGLFRFRNAASNGLAAIRDDPAIYNKRLHEACGKAVALLIVIGRKNLIEAHRKKCSGLDRELRWRGRRRLIIRRWALRVYRILRIGILRVWGLRELVLRSGLTSA